MQEVSVDQELQNIFGASTRGDWKQMATLELKGKDPDEALRWKGNDGLEFSPYYDIESVANLSFVRGTFLPSERRSLPGQTGWLNLSSVTATAQRQANEMALQFLASGADGILFDVCNAPGFAPHELLKGIKWPYCVLSFLLDDKQDATLLLQQYISKDIDPASVRGALFWETIPKKSSLNYFLNQCAHVKSLGFNVPVASPVEEISEALFAGARLYEHHARSHNEHVVINAIAFCLGAESSFFENIAKVRALRALWRQVAVAYGHADFHPMQLHLHVRSLPVTDDSFGPHENMLKGTYSAIAAVMGGCDALTIMAESPRPFVQRWAKNVSPILREECFVDQANDAIAGSYALEAMTYEISRAAWSRFQQKWNGA